MRDHGDGFLSLFKMAGAGFGLWFLFVLLMNLAIIGGIGYAVYWGLSLAERAVETQETRQVQE